ncbi:MFS-type transporter SLC18B1-like [Ischnura elegans]|uniref:MFS-type transporter SLC18B1-like n=1 Tax=Ischnura elegans TaxID=197161 RepID=UPI001ED8AA98|nr:MFS-type transporter SLC18B1-like [Ischnura elegans]
MVASEGMDPALGPPATPPPSPDLSRPSHATPATKQSGFSRRQWIFACVFGTLHFASAACISLQAPFYPEEAESKGISPSQYGFVFGVFELTQFLSSPFFGKYLETLGPLFTYNAGIFVAAVCSFLFGLLDLIWKSEDFLILSFAVRIVEALGTSASVTASFTIIAIEFPETVATTFATLETFFGLGLIAGPTIGGFLYQVGGYKTPFIVMGGILLTAAAVTYVILPDFNHPSSNNRVTQTDRCDSEMGSKAPNFDSLRPSKDGIFAALSIPSIFIDCLSISASSLSLGFIAATLEPHLRQFSLLPSIMGAVFVVNGGFYAFSAPLVGRLCDNKVLSASTALCLGHAFVAVSYFATGPAPFFPELPTILWLSICGLIIHGIGTGFILVPAFVDGMASALSGGFPDGISTYSLVSGLWASSFAFGAFAGPSIGGLLFDAVGFRNGSMVVSSMHTLCILVHLFHHFIKKLEKHHRDTHSNQLPSSSSGIHSNCLLVASTKKGKTYGSISDSTLF